MIEREKMTKESNDKDVLRGLFSGMPDESLPFDFKEKVMIKIRREAQSHEKRKKLREVFYYISGAVAMITIAVFVLYSMGITFEFPEINLPTFTFQNPDYSIFTSPSFKFSAYIGLLAFFLIVIDSAIRRHKEKTEHK